MGDTLARQTASPRRSTPQTRRVPSTRAVAQLLRAEMVEVRGCTEPAAVALERYSEDAPGVAGKSGRCRRCQLNDVGDVRSSTDVLLAVIPTVIQLDGLWMF